ncbi:hypothetical protein EVU97_14825 [Dermacoccus sp. 147Ba]|uniref:hypothetical protein n=1 Tax=Dermacoccus sp. 147Ba TaxID=2510111 RepID=UPI00101B8394|nr:hypothetical protein [Dermacoccus sp. 147Ba]RYI20325.1 hypothetical protein EVU97_14825 [Dermacoccus sp. 147Ba]
MAMLTLTARHHKGQRLEDLWDGLSDAWRFLGRYWGSETEASYIKRVEANKDAWADHEAGERRRPRKHWTELERRVGLLEHLGCLGYVRATEVTYNASGGGWHVHYHVVMILDSAKLPEDMDKRAARLRVAQGVIFTKWRQGLQRSGLDAVATVREKDGTISHVGADLRMMYASQAAETLGAYVTKSTDAVAAVDEVTKREAEKIAAEATLGQLKQGRKGSRTPFQVLASVAATGDADDADVWSEWVRVSRGRTQMVWSNGLAELAKVAEAEKTDEEIAAEEIGTEDLFRLPNETWAAIRRSPVRFDLLEAVETGGKNAGTQLLDSLGLQWIDQVPDDRQGSAVRAVLRNQGMRAASL